MEWFWLIVLFVLGACVGSFLNVLIYRLPRGQSIVFPGSHCPSCGKAIRWYDNVPLLSWLVLGGRCRHCKCRISARYLIIEVVAAVLVSGLYAGYFILHVRPGAGSFADAWPMFAAQATLLCGLLVCSVVDVETWMIPLEVMWVCSVLGVAAAAFEPHPFLPTVSPGMVGVSLAAVVGLLIAIVLQRTGLIQPSFVDVGEAAAAREETHARRGSAKDRKKAPTSAAATAQHGVNPRLEVLREVIFLAPALMLAVTAAIVLRYTAAGPAWRELFDKPSYPVLAPRLLAGGSAVFGYLVGGLWVWGMRILGTLGFGKEAMGLGDVHILAGVGAVAGWAVPSIAFFVAPFFGLSWALYLWLARDQRELPYGPWLALASMAVMIFYDFIAAVLEPFARSFAALAGG